MPSRIDSSQRDLWRPARLLPTVGIRGQEDQEQRATSSLLAVMGAVPDFGHALLGNLGAPGGRISTYTELNFADADGRKHRPDGGIVVERGKTSWSCLVEVKTGSADLQADQICRYLDLAREERFDGVLTISNQITRDSRTTPVELDRRKIKKVELWHLSWWQILTEAIMQHRYRKIADPDQAWLLGELIAYLDHENSGASGFQDMGARWVSVRDAARAGTLRAADKDVPAITERWEQFIQFLCLGLSQDLGHEVAPHRPRKQTPEARLDDLRRDLVSDGQLSASLRVPHAVGPIQIAADLRARTLTTGITVTLPEEGRPLTRINWLIKQLRDAPDDLRITVSFARVQTTTSALLGKAREFPETLLAPGEPKRDPRTMKVELSRPLGLKRGRGAGSFVGDTRRQATNFYGEIVQQIKPWRTPAPKLAREPEQTRPEVAQPTPPAFSDDARLPGDASEPRDTTGDGGDKDNASANSSL